MDVLTLLVARLIIGYHDSINATVTVRLASNMHISHRISHYGLILRASGFPLLPFHPQANLVIVLSSSFPGHKTSPRNTARMQKIAVKNHMMTSRIVSALATPLTASLFSTFPACMVASVRPALGKMNAHQLSEKDILRDPTMTAMVVTKKNQ